MNNAYAIVMAGGRGERFWPLSTARNPKQMLALVGGKPMLAAAVERLVGLIPPERIYVITSADLAAAARRAAPMLPEQNVVGEPCGRDTAAACALGWSLVKASDPDGVFCVVTADHVIGDIDRFHDTLRAGLELAAREDVLVTIGMTPSFPSTGFGYLEAGEQVPGGDAVEFYKVRRFVEKPDRPTAERYLAAGNYFWNGGMFVWSVRSFGAALRAHAPGVMDMAERMTQPAPGTPEFADRLGEEYGKLEKISVDYAVMEKSDNIVMARGTFRWDDIGSWPALRNHLPADEAGNVAVGDCSLLDAGDNIVVSQDRLTALIGVSGLVVVQAGNATLVCAADRAQDVKRLVQQLKQQGRDEVL